MSTRYTPSETASASDDLGDYDVISDADPRSLESSVADLRLDSPAQHPSASTSTWVSSAHPGQSQNRVSREPRIAEDARRLYETAELTAEDVQAYVQRIVAGPGRALASGTATLGRKSEKDRVMRVYVDGEFDTINVG